MPQARTETGGAGDPKEGGPIEGTVNGFVDTFVPPNVLSGWAARTGRSLPLPIRIFAGDRLIGEGRTGQRRVAPPGNCGWSIKLAEPITLADMLANRIRAYAVTAEQTSHPLRIWDGIAGNIEKLAADLAFEAAKPYVSEGELLPPVGSASELRSSIVERGLRGYDLDMTAVLEALDKDNLPIPALNNREGYHSGDDAAYWLFGFDDFSKVRSAIVTGSIATNRVLDFGGSTGRVFRHFFTQAQFREVYACDFKQVSVNWCKSNLPTEIRIFLNSFLPTLPFPDAFFDVITAFSVFTHLDAFEDAWILELSRILRPGGMAYLTIVDEHTWQDMPPAIHQSLLMSPEAAGIDFVSAMAFDRRVFNYRRENHYSCIVFQSQDYIQRHWGRYFEIEAIQPYRHAKQSVVLARKRWTR